MLRSRSAVQAVAAQCDSWYCIQISLLHDISVGTKNAGSEERIMRSNDWIELNND